MTNAVINSTDNEELYARYSWFARNYGPAVQKSCDGFFLPGLQLILLGISKNVNPLMDKDSYFVTKIMVDKNYDIFFRSDEKTILVLLEKALGRANSKFNLNKLTDLEAKIITSFNDYMYNVISQYIAPPPPTLKRINFDVIHLTFLVKDTNTNITSKFIITIPEVLLKPDIVESKSEKFQPEDFFSTCVDVSVIVSKTKFKLIDVKNIELDDIVVFDDSNISHMLLKYKDYEKEVNLNPNLSLVLSYEKKEGESDMDTNAALWDTIEVDVRAQFDTVKISLGELKNIEEGLVVDLTSIYNNKVTLCVDEKQIAKGELVIVNDRYGVKINEILAVVSDKLPRKPKENTNEDINEDTSLVHSEQQEIPAEDTTAPQQEVHQAASEEDEFDYSDFELEDEDL